MISFSWCFSCFSFVRGRTFLSSLCVRASAVSAFTSPFLLALGHFYFSSSTGVCLVMNDTRALCSPNPQRDTESGPELFYARTPQVKIADFGIARQTENLFEHTQTICGTPVYIAPEIVLNEPFSEKADVYRFPPLSLLFVLSSLHLELHAPSASGSCCGRSSACSAPTSSTARTA